MAIANYTRTCGKNVPGNNKVYITEKDNISSITVTAGEVSAVTMATGLTFHELQADKSTVRRKQDETFNNGVLAITHSLELSFKGLSKDLNLRGLESHGKIIGERYNNLETFVVEGTKPLNK